MLHRLAAAARLCLLLGPLAVAACGSPLDALTGPSADELASRAFANLASSRVTHLSGSFVNGSRHFSLDCTVSRGGDAQGAVQVDDRAYELLVSGGQTYVRGQQFWSGYGDPGVARLYGDSWVALQANGISTLGGPAGPCAVARALPDRPLQMKREGEARIAGTPAVELSDSSGKLYVSSDGQPRLLRMVSGRGYRTPDGSSDLRLDFDYPKQFQVAAPGTFIKPSDPQSFPAHYLAEGVKIGKCDASGCSLSASVRNLAGSPAGQSTATLKLRGGDNSELGSCTVNLPAIAYQQVQDVSCTVSGNAWASFYNASQNRQYFARVTIQNPPYDS
jgi:hypothetical protein